MTEPELPRWRQAVAEAMSDPGVRGGLVLGLLVVLGFAGLALAWRGSAAKLPVGLQLPYVVSAGVGSAALIGTAAVLLSVQLGRRERAVDRVEVDRLVRATAAAAELIRQRPVRRRPSLVAVGRTVHRSGCRFASERIEAKPIRRAAAQAEQLRACRVCRPVLTSAAAGEEPKL